MDVRDVELSKIVVPHNRRAAQPAAVKRMADSLLEIGLLEPIGLTEDFRLIYGRHRLEGYRSLGWSKIPAVIIKADALRVELAEIDENIQRNSLSAAQEAKALARRKAIYLALHPETKPVTERGGPGRGNKTTENISTVSFAEDTAAKTGKTSRSIRSDVALGEALDDEAAETIDGSPVADNKAELKQLAAMPAEKQREVAGKIAAGAGSVQEALTGKKKQKRKPKAKPPKLDRCPNCGSTEKDEDGECAECHDPCDEPADKREVHPSDDFLFWKNLILSKQKKRGDDPVLLAAWLESIAQIVRDH